MVVLGRSFFLRVSPSRPNLSPDRPCHSGRSCSDEEFDRLNASFISSMVQLRVKAAAARVAELASMTVSFWHLCEERRRKS